MKEPTSSETNFDSSELAAVEHMSLLADNSPPRSNSSAATILAQEIVSSKNAAKDKNKKNGFQGRGLDVSWVRSKGHRQSVFLTDIDAPSCEEENEGGTDNVEEVHLDSSARRRTGSVGNSADGNGIKDKNVFVLEIVKDRYIRLAIAIIYISFFSLLTLENLFFARQETFYIQLAVLPPNATGDTPVCYPQSDGTCEPYAALNVDQAVLLSNTVVVSDGINATDWQDNGAKPGSPPFTANNISSASFIADPSVLEYSADADLQSFWDNITAVVWTGHAIDGVLINYRLVTISLQFEKLDGDWPANMTDGLFPVHIDSFSCVKGGGSYCESVGNWREILHYDDNPQPQQQLSGNIFTTKVIFYNYYIDDDLVERDAWRFVIRADPSGVVTDCINGDNCIVSIVVEQQAPHDVHSVFGVLGLFILYLVFFIWWLYLLKKRRGPSTLWPHESWWLIIAAVGVMLQMNMLHTSLTLSMLYSGSFAFSQNIWAAAAIIARFGCYVVMFAGACFIDSPRRYVTTNFDFCKYKVIFLLGYFGASIIPVFFYFPQTSGNDQPGTDSHLGGIGYGTSPMMWDDKSQNISVASMFVMIVFGVLSFFYYVWKSIVGFRLLGSLPYGMTRHTQLSFRFFFWATGLWTIAVVSMTIHRIVDISDETVSTYYDDTFRGTLLSLDKAATLDVFLDIESIIFLCVVLIVHKLMFLPPSSHAIVLTSAQYHVTSNDEMCYCALRRSPAKPLMVLEKALLLCICSKEAYLPFNDEEMAQIMDLSTQDNDEETTEQVHSQKLEELDGEGSKYEMKSTSDSNSDIPEMTNSNTDHSPSIQNNSLDEKVKTIRIAGEMCDETVSGAENSTWAAGCRVVSRVYERGDIDIHDTRVIVFRHEFSNDLIVAFRGTATVKQAKTDLMLSQVNVCLDTFLMIPSRTEKIKMKATNSGYVVASCVEDKLISGEITKVRLLDLIPKTTDALPSYLRDAQKAEDKISGIGRIHFGFWSSYNRVRRELHDIIREELIARPGRLILTGHSLGGSQATLCAYDMCRWVLPTVKYHIRCNLGENREILGKVKLSCYTFGSPKCGGAKFVAAYNKVVRDSQRIVCDGDLITSGPYAIMNYFHVKRENIFDFTGTIRVEPSLMEKKFSLKTRNKTSSHKMDNYLKVIRKSFDPAISEEVLLDHMREAYGYKRKNEENEDHSSSTNISRVSSYDYMALDT